MSKLLIPCKGTGKEVDGKLGTLVEESSPVMVRLLLEHCIVN